MVNFILFFVFIALSAFFSASETALFSLSDLKLRRLQEQKPQAKIVKKILKKPTRLLSAIVFGNMLVNIGLVSLSTAVFVSLWGQQGLIVSIFLSGILILFFGEIFPKTLAIYAADKLSLAFAPTLDFFSKTFSPLVMVIEKIVAFFSSYLIRSSRKKPLTDEELRTALLLGKEEGQITVEEEEMISHVLEFKDTWASEILTARIDIEGIDIKSTKSEALAALRKSKHSRFPVYESSLDNIVGILRVKKVFLNPDKDWRLFLREPIFVPESKRIDDLLKLFMDKKERIAIVLDEYGGTEGLVTLEDIEEEIFGEIYDEFETPKAAIEKIDENTWRLYGKTPLKNVNMELDLDLPERENNVAGFLLSKMEKIPRSKEKYISQNMEFTIERATAKRITSVILKLKR
ncbi:MAG: HlyC/CorC family transporter [Candidatus Omnitrophica bacterium]|nr:HlyC/CorC family transporter [Candidatus Omnitrophota bacterium]